MNNIHQVVANRYMAYVVSMGLGLLSQTSNMVEIKVEVAKKAPYGMGILGFVQDLRMELEDPADSIATIISTHVSAGHTVCHPVRQHPGLGCGSVLHLQCFRVSQNPSPSLAQSVARAVGRFGSELLTPRSHCLRISCFEASNAVCSAGDHWKGTLEDKRCLKGAMTGAEANEKEI